ncbi:MAG: acyltransferase [Nibricoccus sp.]
MKITALNVPTKRLPGLDLLRAIAILWVLLFHGMTEGLGAPLPALGKLGWMGVDLFFVLSGYLIGSQLLKAYASGQTPNIGSFYLRRAFRILPTYWVIVTLYSVFPILRESSGMQPTWQFLTFTENFLIDYKHNRTFSHAWSLCVEEHFYLIFPLLVWLLMRKPSWKSTVATGLFIMGGGMLLRAYIWCNYVNVPHPQGMPYVEMIYYPTHARLDGLLAGVMLVSIQWFRPRLWRWTMDNSYLVLGAGVVSIAVAICVARARTDFNASVFGFPLLSLSLALVAAGCISTKSIFGKFSIPGAKAIATITFSLYLSHKMTWHAVRTFWPESVAKGGTQALLIYAGSAFLVGALLYFTVERTFLLLRKSIFPEEQRQPLGTAIVNRSPELAN